MSDEVLATVGAATMRRGFGIGTLWLLGALCAWIALTTPPALPWQAFLLVMACGAAWLGERMRRATQVRIELTRDVLRDTEGETLARVDEIQAIDRGFLAFKPSNGFLVRTRTAGERTWRPGLWWRVGRRIGVGGVASAAEARAMADILAAILAERDG